MVSLNDIMTEAGCGATNPICFVSTQMDEARGGWVVQHSDEAGHKGEAEFVADPEWAYDFYEKRAGHFRERWARENAEWAR